jgi:hypothetical protein
MNVVIVTTTSAKLWALSSLTCCPDATIASLMIADEQVAGQSGQSPAMPLSEFPGDGGRGRAMATVPVTPPNFRRAEDLVEGGHAFADVRLLDARRASDDGAADHRDVIGDALHFVQQVR